jgi:uncharacterized membrane protein
MDAAALRKGLAGMARAAGILLIGIGIVPLVIGSISRTGLLQVLGFVGSVLILQPMAVVVGVGLGIPPVAILLIMASMGISITLGLSAICDTFAEQSAWLRVKLDAVGAIAGKSAMFRRYGILTLVPFIWIPGVGLYGCVLLAWLFRWRGMKGVSVILCGWLLATLLVLGTSIGILNSIQ